LPVEVFGILHFVQDDGKNLQKQRQEPSRGRRGDGGEGYFPPTAKYAMDGSSERMWWARECNSSLCDIDEAVK